MEVLSSIVACMPRLPTSAAALVTLRSPRSIMLEDQAEKLPDSKPSAKIKSEGDGVGVRVGEGPGAGVFVLDGVLVRVKVAVGDVPEVGADISYILPSMMFGSLSLSIPRSTM